MNNKQERLHALERQSKRLEKRIAKLDQISNRYSWTRVAIFFVGIALGILAIFFVAWWFGIAIVVLTLVTFGVVAHYHGKIENSLSRHRIWLHIKSTHIARIQLTWDSIPAADSAGPQAAHPFEIDLDITGVHSVHQLFNTAVSREGSKRLRDWLLNPTPDLQTIQRRQAFVHELTPLTLFRDKLTMKATLAAKHVAEQMEGKRLLHWLDRQAPSKALLPLFWISAALSVLTLLLFIGNLLALVPGLWILTLICSLVLFFVTRKLRGDLFEDAYYLRDAFAMLGIVFEYLQAYPYGKHQDLKKLCEPFFLDRESSPPLRSLCRLHSPTPLAMSAPLRHTLPSPVPLRHTLSTPSRLLKRVARIASASTLEKNQLLWLIVNALVPWDTYCAYRLNQYKAQVAARLPTWLDVWFELEALSSLATFAYLNPEYVLPEVVAREEQVQNHPILFSASDLGHPLIPAAQKVTNDFAMNELGEVVVITGSNMSGKSTFLRTLGVNLCLAYAGGPVNASVFQTTLFRLFPCIRVSDSVVDGYSYFYAEVKRLKALLTELEQSNSCPLFFVIDEIFKGTNNRERLIGSRAYVQAVVGRNCLGVISTHDLELVKLADTLPQVENYSFKEDVVDGQMVFDYRLNPGPCPTTNALKIMQMEGLPVE